MSCGLMVGLKRGNGDENNMYKNPMQIEEVVFCCSVVEWRIRRPWNSQLGFSARNPEDFTFFFQTTMDYKLD